MFAGMEFGKRIDIRIGGLYYISVRVSYLGRQMPKKTFEPIHFSIFSSLLFLGPFHSPKSQRILLYSRFLTTSPPTQQSVHLEHFSTTTPPYHFSIHSPEQTQITINIVVPSAYAKSSLISPVNPSTLAIITIMHLFRNSPRCATGPSHTTPSAPPLPAVPVFHPWFIWLASSHYASCTF